MYVGWEYMTRTRLLCTVIVSCWSGVVPARQVPTSFALPDALHAHVKNERFGIVSSLRGLPLGVREGLQTLFGSQTLDIAEPFDSRPLAQGKPGAETRGIMPADRELPTRRMIVAGCSEDHCVVYYERGGDTHSWHVALFQWRPDATRFEWGGLAPRGLKSIEELRKALLSGAIKGPSQVW
jgi:hypothetical protein